MLIVNCVKLYREGLGMHSFQKNATFLRSFTFFWKERCILCVLLRSFEKKAAFFAFFYFLLKIMLRSLCSFMFFWNECCVLCVLLHSFEKNAAFFAFFTFFWKERKRMQHVFGFHKSPKTPKKNAKERCVLNAKGRGAQLWLYMDTVFAC